MINVNFVKRILISSLNHGRTFQLCQKSIPKFHFSQSNNPNPQKVSPKHQDSQNQSQQPKTQKKSSIQRLRQLKEQKRQQEYQNKLKQIHVTTGHFNPLTAYFWIHRSRLFYLVFGSLLAILAFYENSPFCFRTMGVFKDPFTGKKKFVVINPQRENALEKMLLQIISKQVNFWKDDSLNEKSSQVNKALVKKLQNTLLGLKQKYGVEFKQYPNKQTNFQVGELGQSIFAWVVGDQKLIISSKLLKMSPQSLQMLILLIHSLHSRYLHVQNISFWQRMNLRPSNETKNIIKVEKTFVSNSYSAEQIEETIQLMSRKYGQTQEKVNEIKESILKALKELIANKSSTKSIAEFDLRNRLKEAERIIVV